MGPYQSQAPEEKKSVVAGRGCLVGIDITNVNAATRYAWVFDSLTATGNLICSPFAIGPTQTTAFDFEKRGLFFLVGVYVAMSTSQTTYTASGTADAWIHVDSR